MLRATVFLSLFLLANAFANAADFALCDGDTVVFLGDSITAARTYGKIIENYTLLRFPERRIRFHNAGIGGDTAQGGLKRLKTDVFDRGATVLIVAFGTNDIGWGVFADDKHKQAYLDAVRGIVEQCHDRGVRAYICSAAVTAMEPDKGEDSFLQQMCDEGMALARELGEHSIDVQRSMRSVQRRVIEYAAKSKEKVTLHLPDGAHLTDLGQLAMAWAILKGLDAPAEVSNARIDFEGPSVLATSRCQVTDLEREGSTLQFTRLDDGLPFNGGLFYALNFRFVPVIDELNRYLLRVDHLPPGRHVLQIDGQAIGTYTAAQLSTGVNISSATANGWKPGGTWSAQAQVLQALTDARHQLAIAQLLAKLNMPESKLPSELAGSATATDEKLMTLQRQAAQPRPYRFVLALEEKPKTDNK